MTHASPTRRSSDLSIDQPGGLARGVAEVGILPDVGLDDPVDCVPDRVILREQLQAAVPCLLKKVGGAVGDVQLDPAAVPVDRDRVAIEAEILPYVDELADDLILRLGAERSEEHTSELQ